MALPSSFAPAHAAIYEALTSDTGRTRALATEYLFKRRASKRDDAGTESDAIRLGRSVLVVLRDFGAVPQPEIAPSDRIRYAGICEITRLYHAGNDLMSSEVERARLIAADDLHRVRAALCWPGALATTLAGEVTGIDGGALTAVGHRSQGPAQTQARGFIAWTDSYPITITLSVE